MRYSHFLWISFLLAGMAPLMTQGQCSYNSDTIELQNPCGIPQTDFQVAINLNNGNFDFTQVGSNGDYIRFFSQPNANPFTTSTNKLPYWIEEWDATLQQATIWVKLAAFNSGADTVYMYYTDPSSCPGGTNESNGDSTFIFFDDFNDNSLNTTKWPTVQQYNGSGGQPVPYAPAAVDETNQQLELWQAETRRGIFVQSQDFPVDLSNCGVRLEYSLNTRLDDASSCRVPRSRGELFNNPTGKWGRMQYSAWTGDVSLNSNGASATTLGTTSMQMNRVIADVALEITPTDYTGEWDETFNAGGPLNNFSGSTTTAHFSGLNSFSVRLDLWQGGSTSNCLQGVSFDNVRVRKTCCVASAPVVTLDSIEHVMCTGDTSGAIFIDVTGGAPPYSFAWSDSSTASDLTGAPAGAYNVIVTDNNGLSDTLGATITEPDSLMVMTDSITHVPCDGDATGEIFIAVVDGIPPYSFAWSNNSTDSNLTGVPAGTYTVTVTDAGQCIRIASFTVEEGTFEATAFGDTTLCAGDGAALGVSAGQYFNWSGPGLSCSDCPDPVATPAQSTAYVVEIYNGDSCRVEDTVMVDVQPLPEVNISGAEVCAGETTRLEASSPDAAVTAWQWQLGDGNTATGPVVEHTYDGPDTYQVTAEATDTSGCIGLATKTVSVYENPTAAFDPQPEASVLEDADIFFENLTEGGTSWQWSFGTGDTDEQEHPTYQYQEPGTYEVELKVTNANGCSDKAVGTVLIYPGLQYGLPNAFSPNGDDLNDIFKGKGTMESIQTFRMEIWNRWGEQVFETDDPQMGWEGISERSGNEAPTGTYFYRITIMDFADQEHQFDGYVYLIR